LCFVQLLVYAFAIAIVLGLRITIIWRRRRRRTQRAKDCLLELIKLSFSSLSRNRVDSKVDDRPETRLGVNLSREVIALAQELCP